jgi:hypothetical protein
MDRNILKNMNDNPIARISVKKPIPLLVEKGLMMHIAKINNIDVNTGNEIYKPTEFQLLLHEIKDTTIRCIRNNWLFFLLLLILCIYLYRRYHEVKRRKRQLNKIKHIDYLS